MSGSATPFPIRRYAPWFALTGVGGVGRLAVYVAEQAASQMPFWAQLPWTPVAIFAIGALVGAFYADVANKHSQLRTWWNEKRAFAAFSPVYHKSVAHDRGENHGGRMQHAGVMLPVEFMRKTRLDAIRITGYIYSFRDHMPISEDAWAVHVWKTQIGKEYLKGDLIDVPLAHIPYEHGHPGYYGELGSPGYYLSNGTAHLVIVELIAGENIQIKQFMILLPTKNVSTDGKTTTTGGRFIVFEEGDAVFPTLPRKRTQLFTVDKQGG